VCGLSQLIKPILDVVFQTDSHGGRHGVLCCDELYTP